MNGGKEDHVLTALTEEANEIENDMVVISESKTSDAIWENGDSEDHYDDDDDFEYEDDEDDDDIGENPQAESSKSSDDKEKSREPNEASLKRKQQQKRKRKQKPSNKRRNIRKIFKTNQLDSKTLEAQELEKERLHRLEMQRSVSEPGPTILLADTSIGENDVSLSTSSNLNDSVIILDDDMDSDFSEEDDHEKVILISSSENEDDESEIEDDAEVDTSVNAEELTDSLALKNEKGQILVNPNHHVDEPDVFLPTRISKVLKSHQISGVRFLYDNLIESIKHFKMATGFGCVLAHSMGLGKTIQTIALIHVFLKYTPAKKVLIVVPINTLQNWQCEFNMWLPEAVESEEEPKQNEANSAEKNSSNGSKSTSSATEITKNESRVINPVQRADEEGLIEIDSDTTTATNFTAAKAKGKDVTILATTTTDIAEKTDEEGLMEIERATNLTTTTTKGEKPIIKAAATTDVSEKPNEVIETNSTTSETETATTTQAKAIKTATTTVEAPIPIATTVEATSAAATTTSLATTTSIVVEAALANTAANVDTRTAGSTITIPEVTATTTSRSSSDDVIINSDILGSVIEEGSVVRDTKESNKDAPTTKLKDVEVLMTSGNQKQYPDSRNTQTASEETEPKRNDPEVNVERREYKVFLIGDGQKTTISRAKVIGQWNQNGGVLLIGYEMYRGISMYTPSLCNSVTNAKGKRKKQKAKKSTTVIDIEEEEKEMKLFMGMQGALCRPGPDLVVCDEGHRIKNHQSNIHMALHKIRTRKRLVLTGYPLQNNLTEYWCMVDFVRPNYLGSRQEFQNMFERPIVNGQCVDSTASDKKLMKYRAHVLSSLLKGFVQRRGYTALKQALPPKQEHVIMVRLSSVQQAVYRRFIDLMQEGFGEQLNPIKIFAVCSKIWNHPDILYKAMKAGQSKEVDLFDTDADIGPDDKSKLKVKKDSSKTASNAGLANYASEEGFNPFGSDARALLLKIQDWAKEVFDSHSFKDGLVETSGKFVILLEIIKESLSKGDKMLIFSQSLMTLDLIEDVLGRTSVSNFEQMHSSFKSRERTWKKNVDYYRIDGGTPAVERERLIDAFNKKDNKETKLFMLSTRAGCLGINLIGANRVVVFDVSWNPCHDAQAVCRVYRYGQQKPCYIYRLVASNTMEKRMYYRQISKQGVSDRVVDELNPVENFTKEEVKKLLSTTWEDEPEADYTEECKNFDDSVLQEICRKCGNLIVTTPFKHESLLEDQMNSKLSRADKSRARKAYEEEKMRSNMLFNGPSSFRGAYSAHRPMGQIPPMLHQPYSLQPPQFMQNPSIYAQAVNQLFRKTAGTGNDMNRLNLIASHYNALKERENAATSQLQHPTPTDTLNGIVPSATNTPNSAQTLALIGAMRAGALSKFYAPGVPNWLSMQSVTDGVAPEDVVGVSSNIHQTANRFSTSTNSTYPSNDISSASLSNNLAGDSSSSTSRRNDTEVICLDTDDEDEA